MNKLIPQLISLAIALLATGANAQTPVPCMDAEEKIGVISETLAEAYAETDVEKAKDRMKSAQAQSATGRKMAATCGCTEVMPALDAADLIMAEAVGRSAMPDIQDDVYKAIGQVELGRRAAESCWRKNATSKGAKP
jgi:hypothetical protein